MRELYNNVKVAAAIVNATISASGNGAVIDLQGYQSCMFAIVVGSHPGVGASDTLAFAIQEGDASNGSDMVTVTDTDRLLGSLTLDASGDAATAYKVGFVPGVKRYARLTYTEAGLFSGDVAAVAILGHSNHAPVA